MLNEFNCSKPPFHSCVVLMSLRRNQTFRCLIFLSMIFFAVFFLVWCSMLNKATKPHCGFRIYKKHAKRNFRCTINVVVGRSSKSITSCAKHDLFIFLFLYEFQREEIKRCPRNVRCVCVSRYFAVHDICSIKCVWWDSFLQSRIMGERGEQLCSQMKNIYSS